ncbi:MAG: hydrogenase maturation nickel metallochaperone HypA [Calditrichaeota bacterium]|nr:hydrogenase maturation nickel metallochaperone HypA [Calditrichota bacterium]
MHELSIIESIVDIVLEEMPKHNLTKVTKVSLRIGDMRQVVPDAMQFGFEVVTKNTPLEDAELLIEHIPITGQCEKCKHEFLVKSWLDNCPRCEHPNIQIIAGKELEIAEFEGT